MAFKFNKIGNFALPSWSSGTGNFSVTGAFKYPAGNDFQVILSGNGTSDLGYSDSGGTFKTTHPTLTLSGFVVGNDYWYEESRTVNDITVNIYNYVTATKTIGSLVDTGTGSYGGVSKVLDSFGSTGTGVLDFDGEMSGTWTLTDTALAVRTYEFDQPIGTVGLPESTLGQDGVKANSNNGDYTGSGTDDISITSHTDGQFLQRDNTTNSKVITLSGSISGTQPTSVEYRVDYGDWTLLDAAPTTTTFTGSVTITGTQFVQVLGVGANTESIPIKLTAGAAIIFIGDSNQQGYGINAQPLNLSAISQQPIMWNETITLDLADPTSTNGIGGGGAGGSTLPRIAKLYADDGTAICVYNIGLSGTKASDWQKGNVNYDKMAAFVTLIGEIELVSSMLGTNDAVSNVPQATFETEMNQIINDINTDFSVKTYLVQPAGVLSGTIAGIRSGINNVVATNTNANAGGDLEVIDISSGDGVHLQQDAWLTQAGDIIYAANVLGSSSVVNITLTGIPDGAAKTVLVDITDIDNPVVLPTQSLTYASNTASATVTSQIGSKVISIEVGSNPKTTGGADYGVTI